METMKLDIQLFASKTVTDSKSCGQHSSSYSVDTGTVYGYVDGSTAYVKASLYKPSSGSHACRLRVYIDGTNVSSSSYTSLASKATRWQPTSGYVSKSITRGNNVTFAAKSEAGSDGGCHMAGPSVTLYWCTVSYNGNGSTSGSVSSTSGYEGEKSTIASNGFTKTGYTFTGWNTASNGTGTSYTPGSEITFSSSITLYAQWQLNSYYLDLNGWLDGASSGGISPYGTADVYIGGQRVSDDAYDYYTQHPYGTTYSFSDIKANYGYRYNGVHSGSLSGTITGTTSVILDFETLLPWSLSIAKNNRTTNSITLTASGSGIISLCEFSIGSIIKDSLGTQTFTGLSPDTNYTALLHCSNTKGSSETSITCSTLLPNPTINTPTISNLSPFGCTITATGSINPSRTLQYSFSKDNGTTWTAYQTSNSYNWTGLTEETTYQMKVRVKAIHQGIDASDTTATSTTLSITTPVDQAKVRVRHNGSWTQGKAYIYHNGAWVKAKKLYIYHNGGWKQNINN